jgi:hypothetical protein
MLLLRCARCAATSRPQPRDADAWPACGCCWWWRGLLEVLAESQPAGLAVAG